MNSWVLLPLLCIWYVTGVKKQTDRYYQLLSLPEEKGRERERGEERKKYTYTHAYSYIYIHMFICVSLFLLLQLSLYMYTYIFISPYVQAHARHMYVYIYTYICMCIHIYICTDMQVYFYRCGGGSCCGLSLFHVGFHFGSALLGAPVFADFAVCWLAGFGMKMEVTRVELHPGFGQGTKGALGALEMPGGLLGTCCFLTLEPLGAQTAKFWKVGIPYQDGY